MTITMLPGWSVEPTGRSVTVTAWRSRQTRKFRWLVARANVLAAREGLSLAALIEDGLRLRLRSRHSDEHRVAETALAIWRGRGGLLADVDPLSNRSLEDAANKDS